MRSNTIYTKITIGIFILLTLFTSSCKILYPNLMFKQGEYAYMEMGKKMIDEYVIQPGDQLSLQIFSRDGFKLLDVLSGGYIESISGSGKYSYLVDKDGLVDLPILGEYFVNGFTEEELEQRLEKEYATLFNDPYAILNVINRRAFVFKGSTAEVVQLNEAPTNLLEVLAIAGGLDKDLKAHKVKIIRGDLSSPQVILIDLSTIEGLRNADLIVQANDIIYIEERRRITSDLLRELTPILTLLTTITTVYLLAKSISGK